MAQPAIPGNADEMFKIMADAMKEPQARLPKYKLAFLVEDAEDTGVLWIFDGPGKTATMAGVILSELAKAAGQEYDAIMGAPESEWTEMVRDPSKCMDKYTSGKLKIRGKPEAINSFHLLFALPVN